MNKETQADLVNSDIISRLGLINEGIIINSGFDYNQILYNRVAYLNLFMSVASKLSSDNILLPDEIQSLLDVKLSAYIRKGNKSEPQSYTKTSILDGITDISKLLNKKIINYDDILLIRENRHCIEYRSWLDDQIQNKANLSFSEVADHIQLYKEAIREEVKFPEDKNSYFLKIMKYGFVAGLGEIPIEGASTVARVLDASLFIWDLVKDRFKPKFLFNDYLDNQIGARMNDKMMEDENLYYKQKYGKIQRNQKCPCGSGLKYKNCHGKYTVSTR